VKRNSSKGLANKGSTRVKSAQSVTRRRKVKASTKAQERLERGRQALKEAFEIGASFKADADTWKLIAEDKELEYL
jgi:hypothetical protein